MTSRPSAKLPFQLVFFLLTLCGTLSAQINVEIQFPRSTYLVDEPALATLRITNMAGRDITLGEKTQSGPWCQIQVQAVHGSSPTPRQKSPAFPPIFIRAGETVSRSVNVLDVYDISSPGQYRVRANIVMEPVRDPYVTAPAYFTTDPGKTIWSTTVGVPEEKSAGDSPRTYSVITLKRREGVFLYAKLEAKLDGWRFPPYQLGRMLSAMPPQSQTDRENNLYVFHAAEDDLYTLTQIDVATGRSGQAVYRSKTPKSGRPRMERLPDGRLAITGGIRVTDEEAKPPAAADRAKLSDRPQGF